MSLTTVKPRLIFARGGGIRTLILLLLTTLPTLAQTITELSVWQGYPGNALEKTFVLPAIDSLSTVSATLYYDNNGRVLAAPLQPSVTKTSARNALIRWSGPQSSSLAISNPLTYLKISVGGSVRFGVPISISTRNVNTTPPGSLTVLYPVAIAVPGAAGLSPGSVVTVLPYRPGNVISGYVLHHGRGTPFVKGTTFRDVDHQVDPLWRIVYDTDDSVILLGPPGEVFPGTLKLEFLGVQPNQ